MELNAEVQDALTQRNHESEGFRTALELRARELLGDTGLKITSVEPFGGGNSGQTFLVKVEGRAIHGDYVVRASARGVPLKGPNDIGRQGRIMQALSAAGLAVPGVIAIEPCAVVDGRAAVVLERVDGVGWEETAATYGHQHVAQQAVATLLRYRTVTVEGSGLDVTVPVSPAEELHRWAGLFAYAPLVDAGGAAELVDELARSAPHEAQSGLLHGDFHYGNLLFRDGEVVAVVDWEIASWGPSLMDLGCLAVASLRRRYGDPNPTGSIDIDLASLAEMYAVESAAMAWFTAASCAKYAAIIAYNLQLHRSGRKIDPVYEAISGTIRRLVEDGCTLLAGGLSGL